MSKFLPIAPKSGYVFLRHTFLFSQGGHEFPNLDLIRFYTPPKKKDSAVSMRVLPHRQQIAPDNPEIIYRLTSLFFSPQAQSWSKTVIKDFPLSLRRYSTLGGICGYSVLTIKWSASNFFRFVLSVLSEIVLKYRFSSLNRTTSNSIRQYRITILCLPDMRESV